MRSSRWLVISALGSLLCAMVLTTTPGCSDDAGNNGSNIQCSDGKDNDGDGMTDFPDDLGCIGTDDESEDSQPSPECGDGRDNDGDGKHDFPNDPGCFSSHQDNEEDDCPSGQNCPQCANGIDDDMNGQTDFPDDSGGCMSASDGDEYTRNPVACGAQVPIKQLPFSGEVKDGMLDPSKPSGLQSPMCGGAGPEDVYELRVMQPKVVVASTDNAGTTADTVLYIRSADCVNGSAELTCMDDISTTVDRSTVTKAISTPGLYYLVVDAHDNASAGAYELTVKFLTGEGVQCSGIDDCGPGLVCRVPKGQTQKVCAKHVCEDTTDEDNDGKNGYPDDPGCTTPQDDDESDSCPGVGPNCPECGDGVDNDNDQKTDFGTNGDTTCTAASSASESCVSTDGVELITTATVTGTTVGAVNDVKPTCGSFSNAPDKTYRLNLPGMSDLTIASTQTWDGVVALYGSTCGGTALGCSDEPESVTATNLSAGAYYFLVDAYSTATGAFTLNISGHIKPNESCEGALATAGAITCGIGYQCVGPTNARTCQALACSNGSDDDSDGKIDFPFDPGCTDAADNSEANPTSLPICSDTIDNDSPTDGMIDFPADIGCTSAIGTNEAYCVGETDAPVIVTQKTTTTGSTAGKGNDWAGVTGCQSSSNAPDLTYSLQLPVTVQTLTISTDNSAFDTVMQLRDSNCGTMIQCDDDGGASVQSLITRSNVPAGGYSIIVDGYMTNSGAVTLNVSGVVGAGTLCGFPLFQGGANAVLTCATGTTCTGTPAKCQ